MRGISAESDALHLGMGWSYKDLNKPHIIIESSYGESHPGSSHLLDIANNIRDGVIESGGTPARYFVTDICDGICQGSEGMEYSLLSRNIICDMINIHAEASLCDGMVVLASCDKSLPAHLMAIARLKIPAIVMPGGCMIAGAQFKGCDQMWDVRRDVEKGLITNEEFIEISEVACPSDGACQQFGTAGTMQVISEALGLTMPGFALIPTSNKALARAARETGNQILKLVEKGITIKDILTREAFLNAITVHAAIGGSTNAVMHLLAIAEEAGVELSIYDFDEINKKTPYITNVLSTGKYPTELFWYAGGVPVVMNRLRDFLNLDVQTVTGRTLRENLDEWSSSNRYKIQNMYLDNYRLNTNDIISDIETPYKDEGGIAILQGNIAPEGAIIKHSAVIPSMKYHRGVARVFNNEDDAIYALRNGHIEMGNIIIILYQGVKCKGMPEMFRIGDVIASNPDFEKNIAVITDGRYSGCTKGPAIGYVCPEAFDGGPIALVENGDIVEIDIPNRSLNFIQGKDSKNKTVSGDELLESRKLRWQLPNEFQTSGLRAIYRKLATSPLKGARME